MKLREDEEPCEVERVVEAAHVLQEADDRIDLALVNVELAVDLEHLVKVDARTGAVRGVREEGVGGRDLVEVVIRLGVEQPKVVIVEVECVFLDEDSLHNAVAWPQ